MLLHLSRMRREASGGCQVPGCKHEHADGEPLFIHAGCHPNRGVKAMAWPFGIDVRCDRCNRPVLSIACDVSAVEEIAALPHPLLNSCHRGKPLSVKFETMSGTLVVGCWVCEKELVRFRVLEE